jgi:hypothetical protein
MVPARTAPLFDAGFADAERQPQLPTPFEACETTVMRRTEHIRA